MELRSGRRLSSTSTTQVSRSFASAMELRSGRRLCYIQLVCSPCHGPDHISALPDDLLLVILAGLRCVRTAARTSILSCRWRNLWTLLPVLAFRDVNYSSLEPTLDRVVSPAVSLLDIHIARMWRRGREPNPNDVVDVHLDAANVTSLLRAAARLEPDQFVLTFYNSVINGPVDLPCFGRTASIVLRSSINVLFRMPAGAEFAALDTLHLACNSIGLDDWISGCPSLRVLRLVLFNGDDVATVHSSSLQELFLDYIGPHRVDIVAPVLRQLAMTLFPFEQVNISISAPMVESISWRSSYDYVIAAIGFGRWRLGVLRLKTAERQGQLLTLHIHADISSYIHVNQGPNLMREIEKHMITAFSALELHLITMGHVFGEFVFYLIGINGISSLIRRLKVILWGSKVKEDCPTNCPCCPMNGKVQTISLIALEQMQIDGFKGEDHEYDFLKLMVKSAPMLKRVILMLSHEESSSSKVCTKLFDLFKSYSYLEWCVYLSTGEYMSFIHD